MRLSVVAPDPELRPWIDSLWVFESGEGVPASSSRVIAPNGKAKLILSFRNAIHVEHARGFQEGREGGLHIIGAWDEASVISSPARETGTIGIEFHAEGIARFVGPGMHEIANRVLDAGEVFGRIGRDLEERLKNVPTVQGKLAHLQGFLKDRLSHARAVPSLVDHAARRLRQTHGTLEIGALEKETGYSRRWLDRAFRDHVGLSPKTLAAIWRFQRFYQAWAESASPQFFREDLLEFYYDQAHFSREFKRFTGHAPGRYAQADNEFGRIFYRGRQ